MDDMRVELIAPVANLLGEGPVWSEDDKLLYWLDIKRSSLHALGANGSQNKWQLDSAASCMAICEKGGLILCCGDGIARFDTISGERTLLYPMEYGPDGVRPNDGKVDPMGRLWFGTMWDGNVAEPAGKIFRFDGGGPPTEQFSNYHIPNTFAWSPDQKTMYLGDSYMSTIWAYDYDNAQGQASNKREFALVEEQNIVPDGSAIDCDGYIWNAQWGGGRVVRYAPNGNVDKIVAMPTQNITSCAFGGADLDILYVTSAKIELSEDQLIAQPDAGHLFAIVNTGVCGTAEAKLCLA